MEILKRMKRHKIFNFMMMLQFLLIILYFFVTVAAIQKAFIMNLEVPKILGDHMEQIIHLEVQEEDTTLRDFQNFCKELKENKLVTAIAYYNYSSIASELFNNEEVGNLEINTELNQIKAFPVKDGAFFSEQDLQSKMRPVLVGSELADRFHFKVGDVIHDTISFGDFKIIGILEENSYWIGQTISEELILFLDHQVISLTTEDYVRLHYYCSAESKNLEDTIQRIESIAQKHNIILEATTVKAELENHYETTLNNNRYWLVFAIVLMIIISIGTASLTSTHLYTRKKELGIRLAVGYTPARITVLFTGELLIFTFLAYGIAYLCGYSMIGNGISSFAGSVTYSGYAFTGTIALLGGASVLIMCIPSVAALFICIRKFQPKNLIGGKE